MKVDKTWNSLKRIANGDYVLKGDLISEDTLEIDLDDRLVVRGLVISKKEITSRCGIKAGGSIKASCGIDAGCSIKAGYDIEAGWGIEAGEGIEAGDFISAGKRIFAGISVRHTSENCKKTIRCAELRKGEICYGDLVITKGE